MWVKYFLSINYFYTNDGILEHIGKKSAVLKKKLHNRHIFLDLPVAYCMWFDFII